MPRTDYTGYAALVGESLSSRVGLLEKLLGDAHYPSVGQYKERLLADTIRNFLPRTVEVGTGFVMFPHADNDPVGGPELHDPLNQSAFLMSRQCDILVYDIARFPPVFRDGDFVVVRPEAVRAVIEVKGSLTLRETKSLLESFHDFGVKWRNTQLFYLKQNQPTTSAPNLFAMAWPSRRKSGGHSVPSVVRLREEISSFYASKVSADETDGYPFLHKLLLHNEWEIGVTGGILPKGDTFESLFGWYSCDGRFVRTDSKGLLRRDRDRTVASLLAALHYTVADEDFNRFFSYTDEVRNRSSLPDPHKGTTWTWRDLPTGEFNARVPKKRT